MTFVWIGASVGINGKFGVNRHTGQLYTVQKYKDFIQSIAEATMGLEGTTGFFQVNIVCYMHKTKDIDRFIKPLLDALKGAGIIEDDSFCSFFSVEKFLLDSRKADVIIVEVKPRAKPPTYKLEELLKALKEGA